MTQRQGSAAEAFTEQSSVFDAIDAENAMIGWVRRRVRRSVLRSIKAGDTLLELNAGTGIDSLHFAERGIQVLATDVSEGMVTRLDAKRRTRPDLPLTVQRLSFLDLEQLGDRRFHHVFSNFGGLNCTDRLDLVMKGIDRVLLPGGTCTLVIMPRFSPWESFAFLKGDLRLALRRWRKGPAPANVEGVIFPCHYYTAGEVRRMLPSYAEVDRMSLSLAVPPPHHARFMERWPGWFRFLEGIEDAFCRRWPFRNWGDHFLISLRKPAA